LPWDISQGRHYMNPGGLRLGTSEVTRLGMGRSEMVDIAEFFKELYCFQTSNKAYEYLKFY